ncbi:MAG: hypothetical protein J5745_01195 [Bacteroidales bacterium]|nr:hypothetical protein [Bacteroidales bacterium]
MRKLLLAGAAAVIATSACIKIDNSLGKGLVDKSLLYDTYTEEFPLENITMKRSEDLSGYSSARVVVGAIRDDVFGLTTRESAFTLVPVLDTLNLGTNPKAVSLDLYFASDSISCADDSQARIMQNLYVTELTAKLDPTATSSTTVIPHGEDIITDGLPVLNGSGAMQFVFTKAYAQKYLDKLKAFAPDGIMVDRSWDDDAILDRFDAFTDAIPGIHLRTDEPAGNGGRINLFELSCLSISSNQYYRNNNVAYLQYTNDECAGKDTTLIMLLIPGEMTFIDEASSVTDNKKFAQYAFNRTTHSLPEGNPGATLLVEGGAGLKPVISAKELQAKTKQAIEAKGGTLDKAVISKATIVLPFDMPADYRDMKYFPSILSPTIRNTVTDDDGNSYIQFAGLTDASVSTENQGDIDRSNLMYSPDISYHLQEILKRTDLDTATNADIWLLTIFTETVEETNGNAADNAYLQQLLYASYYNSLYGGYGGYGGYGYGGYGGYGYGSSYSNYYTYAMLAQMMSANSQSTYSTNTELDKDRYYRGILCGPDAARKPTFRVTFAISKE